MPTSWRTNSSLTMLFLSGLKTSILGRAARLSRARSFGVGANIVSRAKFGAGIKTLPRSSRKGGELTAHFVSEHNPPLAFRYIF